MALKGPSRVMLHQPVPQVLKIIHPRKLTAGGPQNDAIFERR